MNKHCHTDITNFLLVLFIAKKNLIHPNLGGNTMSWKETDPNTQLNVNRTGGFLAGLVMLSLILCISERCIKSSRTIDV